MRKEPRWETVCYGTEKLDVEGGFIYRVHGAGMVFVPASEIMGDLGKISDSLELVIGTDNEGDNGFIRVGVES